MDVLTIRKVGGSLTGALPKAAAEQLGLQDKQRIAFEIQKGRIVLDPQAYVRPKYKLADLIAEPEWSGRFRRRVVAATTSRVADVKHWSRRHRR